MKLIACETSDTCSHLFEYQQFMIQREVTIQRHEYLVANDSNHHELAAH